MHRIFPEKKTTVVRQPHALTCLKPYHGWHVYIMIGAFACVSSPCLLDCLWSDPRSGQRENNRGKLLLVMFAEFDMFPVNVDMPCMCPLFTYYSSCGNSVVAYIFASKNIKRIVRCVKVGDEHPCNLSYHLPLIAGIEIFVGINCNESPKNLENEYERIAWGKCASEQVLEY